MSTRATLSPVHAGFFAALLLALSLTAGCARPELVLGQTCSLNTDCASPLVCELGSCRRQCVASRDCGAGLVCLALAGTAGGVCQLPAETKCAINSDCPTGLVCNFGACTTACVDNRDCLADATCMTTNGVSTCVEPISTNCLYNSDCPVPLVCWPDQVCRFECITDRDCLTTEVCLGNLCVPR